jgi:hypothetical protein
MKLGTQSGIEHVKAVKNMNTSDVCTKSTKGEVIRKAGADPEMENVTNCAGAKYGMEGVTDVKSTTHLKAACDCMAPPGSSLFRLRRLQDQLLQSTNRMTPPEASLQQQARAVSKYPPGPSVQPVTLNTAPAPQRWILGESNQLPSLKTLYLGSNGSPHCLAILEEIKSTISLRLTSVMPRYLSLRFLHRADHIESALDTTSRRIVILSKRIVLENLFEDVSNVLQ